MRGYVLIRSNPYMAKTDRDGRFAIENLPVGQHTFRLWHERAGYLRNVRIGSHTTDSKGRLSVAIVKGRNELADAQLPTNMFARDD